jgi:hypothetical protein
MGSQTELPFQVVGWNQLVPSLKTLKATMSREVTQVSKARWVGEGGRQARWISQPIVREGKWPLAARSSLPRPQSDLPNI